MAYARAVKQFFDWCDKRKLELNDIEALSVAAYIEQLGVEASKPTVKQHLAAIRKLFDYLTTGGILEHNPASSVRGPKYVVRRDKTPVLSAEEARKLLTGLDRDDDIDRAARPGSHRGNGLQFRPGRSNGDDAGRRLFPAS
jgi:site-specific recombinase XerD